jgi:3-dehydroquinate dehydratase-1
MICVSVADMSLLDEAINSDAGLIELRLDLIGEPPSKIFPLIPRSIKTIVTCRPGVFDENERIDLLKQGMQLGATYVDIEIETPVRDMTLISNAARQAGVSLIISYHDFERTADREDLESVMIACYEKGGKIAKIATWVSAPDDIRNLLSLYELPGKKVILGMGPMGRITRVMAPYLGAEFTFASVGEGETTAPGQLTVKQLNDIFNVIDKS